jgi:ABC-type multidrug transport system permease subunit
MIIRGMALGFILWLANAAIFRFAGQYFFYPGIAPPYLLFAVVAAIGATITFALLKVLREARGDEAEAAISVALPSLLLNAILIHEFAQIFPNLDGALDGVYGALAMIYAASMALTGLMMTHLAPEDERI